MDSYRYYLRHAPCTSAIGIAYDFYVLLPHGLLDAAAESSLPKLPVGWQYVIVKNACDKYSALADTLSSPTIAAKNYAAVVYVDSSARGPMLPAYVQARVSWVDIFLTRLNENTALVSSSIRCPPAHARRKPRYVCETFAMAFDRAGIIALQQALGTLTCEERLADEFAMPAKLTDLLLSWRYRITSLQYKYSNVNWRKAAARKCTPPKLPEWQAYNMDADPLESVFVKYTSKQQAMGWEVAHYTRTLNGWMDQRHDRAVDIHSNAGARDADAIESGLKCWHRQLGPPQCFAGSTYIDKYPELKKLMTDQPPESAPEIGWNHFVNFGVIEGRYGAFKCPVHSPRALSLLVQ